MTSPRFERKDIISDLPRNIVESILERMPVRDAARTSILSSKWRAGLLQKLSITVCSGIGHLNVNAPNLRVLVIICNSETDSLSFVTTAELRVCIIAMFKKMASLRGKTPSLVEFLADLPRVSDLYLDSFFLELLAVGGPCRLPTISTCVNSLSLYTMVFSDLDIFSCTLLLIQSCPNLMKLKIEFCPITNTYEEQVVNYLEAPTCMFQSEQTLTKLLSVNIDYLGGLKPQLLLIKLFLGCSPKLETLFVELSLQLDVNERFKISKELSQFPRLSPKASVIYLHT
ncbi:F-box/FBD/LRR-repeat protein At1g13570-like [Rhododendron vialii]|uniref:F-box/FBD/LRR-repeat protein At1g13570-like n=1 Tax=Rhododendron vialii TaxID=182163 RepID=UPI00265DB1AB|nr:F-box/FBD/LRR-repeat protein At1g13570-like [Rhododendron vialii]